MVMRILTASCFKPIAKDAVAAIKESITQKEKQFPAFLLIYFSACYNEQELREAFLAEFPGVNFTGVQTYDGSFEHSGVTGFPEETSEAMPAAAKFSVYRTNASKTARGGVSVMAIYDEHAAFGSVLVPVSNRIDLNGSQAIRDAQEQANRLGVMPDLMLIHEINVPVSGLRTEINNVLGSSIPIAGGGIPAFEGVASGFTQDASFRGDSFYLLTLFYVHCRITVESHSTCECGNVGAMVTRSSEYEIAELDHQPAADLFFRWIGRDTEGKTVPDMQRMLAEVSSSFFVGRQKNSIRGEISYDVSIVRDISQRRGIITSRSWTDQDEIHLMRNDNTELFQCFLSTGVSKPGPRMLAALHVMCMSFSSGCNKEGFMRNVVYPVRRMYDEHSFIVCAMNGEFGKDIEGGLILGNYTVSTVYFLEW